MWPFSKIKEQQADLIVKQDQLTRFKSEVEALEENAKALQAANDDLTKRIENLLENQVGPVQEKAPFFKMWTAGVHPELGMQVQMDWSPEMIVHLRQSGISGLSDDLCIQKWLAFILANICNELEETAIEKAEEQTGSEFQ